MLRLVTYYTPSHEAMCQRYVLSRAYGFSEVRSSQFRQTCPSGSFKQPGWEECMLDKLRCLMALPMDGQPALYVDADVALMPGLHDWAVRQLELLPFDGIGMSEDVVQWCAGVMLFRCTPKVHAWWRLVAELSTIWCLPDQDVIDQLRRQCAQRAGVLPVKLSVLDSERVCNWATLGNRDPWRGQDFEVPPTCVAWHANWVVGVDLKEEMLRRVVLGETRKQATVSA